MSLPIGCDARTALQAPGGWQVPNINGNAHFCGAVYYIYMLFHDHHFNIKPTEMML